MFSSKLISTKVFVVPLRPVSYTHLKRSTSRHRARSAVSGHTGRHGTCLLSPRKKFGRNATVAAVGRSCSMRSLMNSRGAKGSRTGRSATMARSGTRHRTRSVTGRRARLGKRHGRSKFAGSKSCKTVPVSVVELQTRNQDSSKTMIKRENPKESSFWLKKTKRKKERSLRRQVYGSQKHSRNHQLDDPEKLSQQEAVRKPSVCHTSPVSVSYTHLSTIQGCMQNII